MDRFSFFGDDFGLSVLALAVAEEVLILEYNLTFLGTLSLAPFDIGTDVFRFALGDAAVDGDVKEWS